MHCGYRYDCKINIFDLITLRDAMQKYKLGPNGGLVYCIEYLDKNFEWLSGQLESLKGAYCVFLSFVLSLNSKMIPLCIR